MANRKNKSVMINVDSKFFKNVFERDREKMQKQLGIALTQTKFTAILAMKGIRLDPKLNLMRGINVRKKKSKKK